MSELDELIADIRRVVLDLASDAEVDLADDLEDFLVAVRECRAEPPGPIIEDCGF